MVITKHSNKFDKKINSSCDNIFLLKYYSELGSASAVETLLKDSTISKEDLNFALLKSCYYGHENVVKILLNDCRSDPESYLLTFAIQGNQPKIVELLLKNNKINPNYMNNYAVKLAIIYGNLEIVKILLKDKRVDPGTNIISLASDFKPTPERLEIMKLLLKDSRVDPNEYDNYALKYIINNSNFEYLELLLNDKRFTNIRAIINSELKLKSKY